MKHTTNYLKMRVLGALEYATGHSMEARYQAVAAMTFLDEDSQPRQFTWRTIQTWWFFYRKHGITESPQRADKDTIRKVSPELLATAIETVLPSFHGQPRNIAVVYRECIRRGLIRREQVAPNTFRRIVKKFDLLKPLCDHSPKARLAFAKAHANDLWQADTLHGPYLDTGLRGKPIKTYLICFIDDASRVVPHGAFTRPTTPPASSTPSKPPSTNAACPRPSMWTTAPTTPPRNSPPSASASAPSSSTPPCATAAKGKIERFFRTVRDEFLTRDLSHIHTLRDLNAAFIEWLETTYHNRIHTTLGMKPIDRFGLDLDRIRYLAGNPYSTELFMLEDTRKVRIDNTFSFNARRYEAPRDMRNKAITIRYHRHTGFPPAVYEDGIRLGDATLLDPVANDRRPDIGF